ncbi:3-oxoacyl-[acyl-carrier-protein] reductase [Candidatus Bathyarchaeota archaeon]|nr:MAG: 3-oxoacyl-[acyl-carrier-protein] reductase [Candidatus Bathyarchaeota archaeon]
MELEGKVSLVTGASRGIGRAIALKLANLGSKVAVNYRSTASNKADAANAVESIIRLGREAMPVEADIRDGEAVKTMVEQVIAKWDKIDILVNNAGINRDTLLLRMSDDAWDDVINTNLRGAYLCTKFAVRYMMRQEWGRIINISSVVGRVGNAGQSNYAAAKGGIIAFTKSIAREMGSRNITANTVAPGFIVTEMTNKLPLERRESMLAMIPLQRLGQPEDVAELVGFLATERAGYITGQVITIDGGAFP